MPERIQRRRTKGWKMPDNTVYVGRPGKWGNPFKMPDNCNFGPKEQEIARVKSVENFQTWLEYMKKTTGKYPVPIEELRGKNLACWCPLGQPCHADILLTLVNKPKRIVS